MKTILDEANTWFLESLAVDGEPREELCIVVVEGIEGQERSDLEIAGTTLKGSRSLEPTAASRYVMLRFQDVPSWQVMAEMLTGPEEYESSDGPGFLTSTSRSRYLDHVLGNPTLEALGRSEAYRQYRIWTEFQVIDVIAASPPSIEVVAAS